MEHTLNIIGHNPLHGIGHSQSHGNLGIIQPIQQEIQVNIMEVSHNPGGIIQEIQVNIMEARAITLVESYRKFKLI